MADNGSDGPEIAEVYLEHKGRQHRERPDSCKNSTTILPNTEAACGH